MEKQAKDVMTTNFHTLSPDISIWEAVSRFKQATHAEDRRIFGMMVTDKSMNLIGMLSMYDILLFLRPKHIDIWGEMEEIIPEGVFATSLNRMKSLQVEDLMTTEVVSISPDTNLLMIIEIMIKYHIRRIPVLEDKNILGIVYLSDLFYNVLQQCEE